MKRSHAKVLLAIGVLVLLMGVAMPSTETNTSRSCVNDPYGYGETCSQSTYEVPNSEKGPTIFFGIILSLIGGVSLMNGASNSSSANADGNKNSDRKSSQSNTLVEQVEERQSEMKEQGDADEERGE